MRRAALVSAATAVLATSLLAFSVQAAAPGLAVPLDQSRRVPFRGNAAHVIPGNPDLIFTNIVSPTDVRVIGRKLGVTNLVVLDANGTTLFDQQIVVSAGDGSVVTVYRAGAATDYACAPYCAAAQGNPGFKSDSDAPGGVPNIASAAQAVGSALGGGGSGSSGGSIPH